ncbi:MAG: zinc-dependent metalloprotease [Acidobacteriia bacterium]|nr:zinc-dependent metalloprotease [Terriglobia bacterium]
MRLFRYITLLILFAGLSMGQTPPSEEGGSQRERPGMPGMSQTPPEPKPYEKVITKEAKSKQGIFTVHQVKEKWYYEIPKTELDKEFLWVSQIARTTLGAGYGGQALGSRVVRWERINNRVLLRDIKYDIVADPKEPVALAVKAANNDTILMSFNIEAWGKDEAPVIDVTRLFTTDLNEISAHSFLRASSFDSARSFIDRIATFPTNIEVETTHTYTSPPPSAGGSPSPTPQSPFAASMRGGSATVVLHYSMVKLPEKPMMPRVFDERVGYFTVRQIDYGRDEHRAPKRTYITRYRLEKKDPTAALSEPVKPIVYYIDPATPKKWVPYIKRGVEAWQVAFEEAGFKNAILAKDAPAPEQDPDWSPDDARYSVIRWLPSTVENAMGPHVSDPRTGEILEADISMYHNIMNLQRSWYFLQVGPLDPRAQKLPLPDDLMGRLIEYVVAHEVGHTLGFQHNMKASSMYPQEKLRDREWVKKMGHTPSIMDYARFNYVAQPEDNIDVDDLVPGIGPYDKWATMWGYKPIPGAKTPDEEKATLDEWSRQQDKTPWLRFSTPGSQGADFGELTEAVGDANAIKSTALGLKNLERVSNMLLTATTTEKGEPYDDLEELYGRMLGQWTLEMNHVAAIVGGFNTQEKYIGQDGVIFQPLPRDHQAAAVKFLNDNAFMTPSFFIKQDILRRIEPVGVIDRVRNAQRSILNSLMNPARLARLVEQEAVDGKGSYAPTEFLADVRKGVWKELDGTGPVKIDAFRRNLQRSFVELMDERLNRPAPTLPSGPGFTAPPTTGDVRPFFRGELKAVSAAVTAALPRTSDRETRLHLEDIKDQIAKVLDPKIDPPSTATPTGPSRRGNDLLEDWQDPNTCWPDYQVKR